MGRKAILTELHPAYYRQAVKNLTGVEQAGVQTSIFDLLDLEAA